MKTLILGDIHGRPIWRDIIEKEKPDRVIFLGDYVSTHDIISSEQQIEELEGILKYKEQNKDIVILLRGNHDVQHLGYYWAECSGYDRTIGKYMSSDEVRERYLADTQWIYVDDDLKTIFSHAGVSQVWMDNSGVEDVHRINDLEPSELFGFNPDNYFDMCGTSKTQPPTWIRPETLCMCNVVGWDQVVGHTPQRDIHKIVESTKGKHIIWLCDTMGSYKYLVIEDREFIPKSL